MASKIPTPGQHHASSSQIPSRLQPPKTRRKLPVPPAANIKQVSCQLEEDINASTISSKPAAASQLSAGFKQDASKLSSEPTYPQRARRGEKAHFNQNGGILKPKESSSIPRFSSPNRIPSAEQIEVRLKLSRNSSDVSDSSSSSNIKGDNLSKSAVKNGKKSIPRYTSPNRGSKSNMSPEFSSLLAKSRDERKKSFKSTSNNQSRSSLVETIRSSLDKATDDLNNETLKQSSLQLSKSLDHKEADAINNKNENKVFSTKSRIARFFSPDRSLSEKGDKEIAQTETSDTEVAWQSHRSHLHHTSKIYSRKTISNRDVSIEKDKGMQSNKKYVGNISGTSDSSDPDAKNISTVVKSSSHNNNSAQRFVFPKKQSPVRTNIKSSRPLNVERNRDTSLPRPTFIKRSSSEGKKDSKLTESERKTESTFQRGRTKARNREPSNFTDDEKVETNHVSSDQNDSGVHSSKDSENSGLLNRVSGNISGPQMPLSTQQKQSDVFNVVKLTDSLLSVYEIQEGDGNISKDLINDPHFSHIVKDDTLSILCSSSGNNETIKVERNAQTHLTSEDLSNVYHSNKETVISSVSVGQLSNSTGQDERFISGPAGENNIRSRAYSSGSIKLRNNQDSSNKHERHSWGNESSFEESSLATHTWHAGDVPAYVLPVECDLSNNLVKSSDDLSGSEHIFSGNKYQEPSHKVPPFGGRSVSYLSTFIAPSRSKMDRSPTRQITVQVQNTPDNTNSKPPMSFVPRMRPNSPRTMSPLLAIKPQMIRRNSFKERMAQERPVVKKREPRNGSPVVGNPGDRSSLTSDTSEKSSRTVASNLVLSKNNDSSDDQSPRNTLRNYTANDVTDTDQEGPPKLPPKINSPRNRSPVLAFPFGRNSPLSANSPRTGKQDSGSESDAPMLPPRRSPRSSPNSLAVHAHVRSSSSSPRRPASALPVSSRENSPVHESKGRTSKVMSRDNSPLSLLLSNNRKIQEANSMVFTPIRNSSPFRGSAPSTPTEEQNLRLNSSLKLDKERQNQVNKNNLYDIENSSSNGDEKQAPSQKVYSSRIKPPSNGSRGNSPVRASHDAHVISTMASHQNVSRCGQDSPTRIASRIPTFENTCANKNDNDSKIPQTQGGSRGNSPVRIEPQVIPPRRPRSSPPVISYTDRNDSPSFPVSSGIKVLASKSSKQTFFTKQDPPKNKPPLGRSVSKESRTSSDSARDDSTQYPGPKRFVRQDSVGDSDSSINTESKPKKKIGILKQFSDDSDGSDYSLGKGGRDSPSRKRVTFDKEIIEREAKKELKDAKLKATLANFVKKRNKQMSQSSKESGESQSEFGMKKKFTTMTEADMEGVQKFFLSNPKRKRSSNSDSETLVRVIQPLQSKDSDVPIYSTVDKSKKRNTFNQPDSSVSYNQTTMVQGETEGEYVSLSDLKNLQNTDNVLDIPFDDSIKQITSQEATEYLQYLEETDLDHIEVNIEGFDENIGTTRPPRPGENNGVDYTFLTVEEFMALEKSGNLLESGTYEGHQYGTPKPPKDPIQPVRRTNSMGAVLIGTEETRRKRNRSVGESMMNKDDYPDHSNESSSVSKSVEKVLGVGTPDLGPLPSNWEMAYTEDGTPYFIDHNGERTQWQDPRFSAVRKGRTGQLQQHKIKPEIPNPYFYNTSHTNETTHWLDPRLAKNQKMSPLDCKNDELPYGWEKVEDPHYGTYFIDHVNRKTQYENPVIQAKRIAHEAHDADKPSTGHGGGTFKSNDINGNSKSPPAYSTTNRPVFTKNPDQLRGDFLKTQLQKSPRGFGFTILGGNERDKEFLQIKNIVPGGIAFEDGVLKSGDVLVYVKNNCVLGFTHSDVIHMFQSIPIGEKLSIEVLRGYPLPFDPDDPNTEIVTTVAVTLPQDSRIHSSPPAYSADTKKSHNKLHQHKDDPFSMLPSNSRPELLSVNIAKGAMGFGFTIADSAYGQKVRQILDRDRCKTLQEGDILVEINRTNVKDMPHSDVVGVLKECTQGLESTIVVQRGGMLVPNKNKRTGSRSSPRTVPDDSEKGRLNDHQSSNVPRSTFYSQEEMEGGSLDEGIGHPDAGPHLNESHDSLGNQVDKSGVPDLVANNTHRSKTPTYELERGRSKSPANMLSYDRQYPASNSSGQSRRDGYSNHSSEGYSDRTEQAKQGYNNSHQNNRGELSSRSFGPADRQHQNDQSTTARFRSRTPGPDFMRGRAPDEDQQQFYQQQRARSKTPTFSHSSSISGTPDFIPASQYQSQHNQMLASVSQEMQNRGINSSNMNHIRPGEQRAMRPLSNPDLMQNYNNVVASINPSQSYNSALSTKTYPSSSVGNSNDPRLAGRKQSTSFEYVDPVPSNLTRIPPGGNDRGEGLNRSRSPSEEDRFVELSVQLHRQESGFGFRIIGGTEEGSQVSVGHIVPGGAADQDSRLRPGDEIVQVDGVNVIGCSHHKVVQIMGQSAFTGTVTLMVRRRLGGHPGGHPPGDMPPISSTSTTRNVAAAVMDMGYPFDIVVSRMENEGFGFVIISSVTRAGSVIDLVGLNKTEWIMNQRNPHPRIGRIIEGSPAERCGKLHVGDRILAVNGSNIMHMHHEDIVNLIKDSGYAVTLTVGPPQDDASSTTSHNSQRSSGQGSVVNTAAYPAHSESDLSWRSDYSPHHNPPHMVGGGGPQQQQPPVVPAKPRHILEKHKEMARQMAQPSSSQASPVSSLPEEDKYYQVELHRGSRGFGFSIRGGKEFNNMPLFVLKVAPGGAADQDGRLRVGDQIIEINGHNTTNMTHAEAIDLIQNGGSTVKALVKRTGKLPPHFGSGSGPPSSSSTGGGSQIPVRSHHHHHQSATPTLTLPNGPPIGPLSQSSPNPNRRPPETSYFQTNFPNY